MGIGLESALHAVGIFFFPAAVSFVMYYLFAIPLIVVCMFILRWGLDGFWIPYTAAAIIECAPTLLYLFLLVDWPKVVEIQATEKQNQSVEKTTFQYLAVYHCSNTEGDTEPNESTHLVFTISNSTEHPLFRRLLILLLAALCVVVINGVAITLRINRPLLSSFDYNSTSTFNPNQ